MQKGFFSFFGVSKNASALLAFASIYLHEYNNPPILRNVGNRHVGSQNIFQAFKIQAYIDFVRGLFITI